MISKRDKLSSLFKQADIIMCTDTGTHYHYCRELAEPQNDLLQPDEDEMSENDKTIVLTKKEYEEAVIDAEGGITFDTTRFECIKTVTITPPVELMSQREIGYLMESIADQCDGSVRDNYSGRCMYGKRCWGIVADDINAVISAAAERGIKNARQDNMGLSTIVYWPQIVSISEVESESVK